MKTEFVRFLFPLAALLLGGAVEEALPKVLSVGFPVLMTVVILFCTRCTSAEAVILAILAGLLEDALCGMPLATTASFLLVAVLAVRALPVVPLAAIVAYPLYQFWLVVWTTLPAGELWIRLFLSVPIAAVTVAVLRPILLPLERRVIGDAR